MEINETTDTNDPDSQGPGTLKLKYPRGVIFILTFFFCERFNYIGIKSILALYIQSRMNLNEQLSIITYHTFAFVSYFTPLLGAMTADSWLGKFWTIYYVSIIYLGGNALLFIGSLQHEVLALMVISLVGLFLIGTGTSGVKPCVSPFTGDQFKVPQQEKQLENVFSFLYMAKVFAGLFSMSLLPWLKSNKCLGFESCYPLSFGVGSITLLFGCAIFYLGKQFYRLVEPAGKNIILEVIRISNYAFKRKIKSKEHRTHWIDFADDKFNPKFIEDTKRLYTVVLLFSPAILFWALFEQQGSRWTFQANHMDGRLGMVTLQPEHMQAANHILLIVFIPLFQMAIFPNLIKCKMKVSPLQKMCAGGFMAAIAFAMAGFLQLRIQVDIPRMAIPNRVQLRLFNLTPQQVSLDPEPSLVIEPFSMLQNLNLPLHNPWAQKEVTLSSEGKTAIVKTISFYKDKTSNFIITVNANNEIDLSPLESNHEDESINKVYAGFPKLRIIYDVSKTMDVEIRSKQTSQKYKLEKKLHQTPWEFKLPIGKYDVNMKCPGKMNDMNFQFHLDPGGVYALLIARRNGACEIKNFVLIPPSTIHMLWQIPQYVAITLAEVMFSVTGMILSYTQSPKIMKTAVSSYWLMTGSLGNLIVVSLTSIRIFENQAHELFLYSALMAVVMLIFVVLAIRYKYVEYDDNERLSWVRRKDVKIKSMLSPF